MRLARVLGAVGRGLISAGVIVLLFVVYQLWGTGIQNAASQNNLGNEFAERTGIQTDASDTASLAEQARANQETIAAEAALTNADASDDQDGTDEPASEPNSGDGTADLVENNFDAAADQQIRADLYPGAGEALARMIIPAINVDQIVVQGVSVEDLRKGPGLYPTTSNPGQAGNAAIAGHRTTYGAPFHRIDELKPGDPIFVTTAQGLFEYRVLGFEDPGGGPDRGYFIVSPSDTWVLDQKPGQNILTLTACHPKYSARQRIIVQAELVGEPAPTIPRDGAIDLGPATLDSGDAVDERAAEAAGIDGDTEIPDEELVIMGDDVAADDDPSVDADGNPIDTDAGDTAADDAGTQDDAAPQDEAAADDAPQDAAQQDDAVDQVDDEAEMVDLPEEGVELTSAQTPLSTDDFGEGLNGDPTKVKPAMLWAVSGLFIWIAAWFMGKRLDRKWTLYAVGLLPFVMVLWSTFVNVDQALPSY